MVFSISDNLTLQQKLDHLDRLIKTWYSDFIGFAVAMLDDDNNLYTVYRSQGYGVNFPSFIESIHKSSRLSKLKDKREPDIIDDMMSYTPSIKHIHSKLIKQHCLSSMASPIYDKDDKFIGIIFLNSRIPHFFSVNINFFTTISIIISLFVNDDLNIKYSFHNIIRTLLMISHHKDPETQNHLKRVAEYSRLIALHLGKKKRCNGDFINAIYHYADMHDIGKYMIPEEILFSTKIYTDAERKIMNEHPELGYQLLLKTLKQWGNITDDNLTIILNIVRHHHERYDGKGFPLALKGEDIPLEARIVTVADVTDALLSHRTYKKPWSIAQVIDYLQQGKNKQFDPLCVDAMTDEIMKANRIKDQYPDS
ncbi:MULTISPECIES: HD domain-containing phosphohydrolase [unclassified Photobacterium]|uniref:HD-GYP domain-containing protein n=1 Tax=unclassified Photobacterium TaxID=2628852 RepID=UPI001EDF45B5|nr:MULTISPECIES: HD domain-containing phosphohydrolase [unclassified Photobacterium]MCG3864716.1 HD domain-containing protein [Photobacterium sp. Ph6]MCG3876840.1 HD domain-containing protein [Photobacterium sp. Ph5]